MIKVEIHVGEEIDPSEWPPLPVGDRLFAGGSTVWIGVPSQPMLVAQPNRWGLAERDFPEVPCVVEADPLVTAALILPPSVAGWVDRAHRPIEAPKAGPRVHDLLAATSRVAKMIDQISRVRLVAPPNARTVVFTTPREPDDLIESCRANGLTGIRALDGIGGGVAVAISPDHRPRDLLDIVAVLEAGIVSSET